MFKSSRVQQFTCQLSQHPTHIYFECAKRDMVKNALGSSVFYFQVLQTSADPHYNLLRLLKQPIFDKIDLLHFIHDTTKECDFYRTRVRMTLIHCSLLPMVIIARCSPKTDNARHWHFSIALWINLNFTHRENNKVGENCEREMEREINNGCHGTLNHILNTNVGDKLPLILAYISCVLR